MVYLYNLQGQATAITYGSNSNGALNRNFFKADEHGEYTLEKKTQPGSIYFNISTSIFCYKSLMRLIKIFTL